MSYYNFNNCPWEVKQQLDSVVSHLKTYFTDSLVGVYLHGSLCLGYFVPGTSDVDLLIIINKRLSVTERMDSMKYFLSVHKKPAYLELSIISAEHLQPWQHPVFCQFHFSEYWYKQFEQFVADNDMTHWMFTTDFTDGDIACHITLTNQNGICLFGSPVSEVFPQVPEEDFWDSIVFGVDYFCNNEALPYVLELCRIWSYKVERRILSKMEAWLWAEKRIPDRIRYIVRNAAEVRYMNGTRQTYNDEDLNKLKNYLVEQIKA